ncbi:MinD/ParA family ATP-binding protein [Rhodococcus qingshengii]|uniref:MinD/ParA family ATP-binding protein n=1 Tax=Rhodococcus qingshengii TaxID=334542 RepID=UPI00287F7D8C|nr:hypothetical protein [Rhodococcus qingshengii]
MSTFGPSDDENDLARIRAGILAGKAFSRDEPPKPAPQAKATPPAPPAPEPDLDEHDSPVDGDIPVTNSSPETTEPAAAETPRPSFAGVRPRNRTPPPPVAPPVATHVHAEPEGTAGVADESVAEPWTPITADPPHISEPSVDIAGANPDPETARRAPVVDYYAPAQTPPSAADVATRTTQTGTSVWTPHSSTQSAALPVATPPASAATPVKSTPPVNAAPPVVAPTAHAAAEVGGQLGISAEDLMKVLQQNPHLLTQAAAHSTAMAETDTDILTPVQVPIDVDAADRTTDTSLARADLATAGWRAWFVKFGVPLRKGAGERHSDLMEWAHTVIRRELNGSVVIGVTSYRGSCGKTSMTVMLGRLLAEIRGENIVALDTDLYGTLMSRALGTNHESGSNGLTMSGLANHLQSTGVDVSRKTWDGGGGFSFVPGSRTHKANTVTAEEYRRVVEAVRGVNSIVLVDMAALNQTELYQAVLESLDGLVMMSPTSVDAVDTLYETQADLDRRHVAHLNQHRITILNNTTSTPTAVDIEEFARGLKHRDSQHVVDMPFDRHLSKSKAIDVGQLTTTTRTDLTLTLAALIDTFDSAKVE